MNEEMAEDPGIRAQEGPAAPAEETAQAGWAKATEEQAESPWTRTNIGDATNWTCPAISSIS